MIPPATIHVIVMASGAIAIPAPASAMGEPRRRIFGSHRYTDHGAV
jgi:hypothetical protein